MNFWREIGIKDIHWRKGNIPTQSLTTTTLQKYVSTYGELPSSTHARDVSLQPEKSSGLVNKSVSDSVWHPKKCKETHKTLKFSEFFYQVI